MSTEFRVERLALIGVGLIGGSLALALRQAGAVGSITGYSRRAAHREEAQRIGIVDHVLDDPVAAVADADLVVVAAPVSVIGAILDDLRDNIPAHAVVTDVGSVKGSIVEEAKRLGNAVARFVPGHPIAGTERSGPGAARPDLFRGRRVVLTPTAQTDPAAVARVRDMWAATGAIVSEMDPDQHDEIFAATSHLPHALAYCLVNMLAAADGKLLQYTGGGFQDFTRIASSDPEMWRDIYLANRSALVQQLRGYGNHLEELTGLVDHADSDGLLELFRRAKRARDGIVGNGDD